MDEGHITSATLKGLGSIPKANHHAYGLFMVSFLSLQTNDEIQPSNRRPERIGLFPIQVSTQITTYVAYEWINAEFW
jgi:hypothetical protein